MRAAPPPSTIGDLIAGLEAERVVCDRRSQVLETAITELKREWSAPAPATPAPTSNAHREKPKSGMQAGWKHRRRCPHCEQLTPTDPCAHCGEAFQTR